MQQDDAGCVLHVIVKGDYAMLRKLLLPLFATAALAGCATDYQYRGGNGDYYYGQPRVEYRHSGPGGFYGDIGLGYGYGSYGLGSYGFGATYFYDRYGRLVYGNPRAYYNSPYYGRNPWYPPRPPRGHRDHDNQHGDGDNRPNRPPPWRDLGGLQQSDPSVDGYRNREARERQFGDRQMHDRQMPDRQTQRPRLEQSSDAPIRMQRQPTPSPATSERRESSSRMGRSIGGAARSGDSRKPRIEE